MKKQKEKDGDRKPRNVIMKKILVDEFETDDDMKDIEYDDIKSEGDLDN